MTKLASYEQHKGKRNESIGSYFRGDYISLQVIKSVVCATIAFVLVFGLYLLYNFESFMADLYKMDLMQFVKGIFFLYLVVIIFFALFSFLIYSSRYRRARKGLKIYYSNLKKLNRLYENDQR